MAKVVATHMSKGNVGVGPIKWYGLGDHKTLDDTKELDKKVLESIKKMTFMDGKKEKDRFTIGPKKVDVKPADAPAPAPAPEQK